MTSSSLQFGPEWMRKPASAKQQSNSHSPAPSLASAQHQAAPQAKRHPSLGTMSPAGPTPVLTPTNAPSPGAFSFAAAAAGGMDRHPSSNLGHSPSNSFSAAAGGGAAAQAQAALDREAALRYARDQSLSLYSSKGNLSPSTEGHPMSADGIATAAINGSDVARKKPSIERDGLKRLSSTEPLSPTLPSEPRGLNARGAVPSNDRERPGLFQRASSGGSLGRVDHGPSSGQPTTVQRERFSGIQGGVLSGVVPPEQQRRRKESSESTSRLLKHSPAPSAAIAEHDGEEASIWERRGGSQLGAGASEAFASAARMGKFKPSAEGAGLPQQQDAGSDKAWASGRRRERGPSEVPAASAAEGSAGFAKFAGYDRKRERTGGSNADSWRSGSALRASPSTAQMTDDEHAEPGGDGSHDAQDAPDSQALERDLAAMDVNGGAPLANASWSAELQQWFYRDPSGQVQGPFTATTMHNWCEQQYFGNDLMVRPQEEIEFYPLGDYAAAAGGNSRLFLNPPPSMRRNVDEHIDLPPRANGPQDTIFDNSSNGQMPNTNIGWDGGAAGGPGQGWYGGDHLSRAGVMPSQAFGSPFGAFGGLPQSPFLPHAGAGDHMNLDARLRQQEEYIAVMRQREFDAHHRQQQQQHLHTGPFDGGYPGMDGWAREPQLWPAQPQQHQQVFEQAPAHQQSPWSTAAIPSAMTGEDAQAPAPWGPTPELKHQQQSAFYHADAADHGAIGTPVRARSPAPAPAEPQEDFSQPAAQYALEEPAVVNQPDQEVQVEEQPVEEAAAPVEEEPARPSTPPPVDPAPEHEWPQSPSAVEFASEPDFSATSASRDSVEAATTVTSRGTTIDSKKSARPKAGGVGQAGKPGSFANPSAAGGNVQVVGADQFRKGGQAAESTAVQTPLSSLMDNGPQTPSAAKVAPWAPQNNDEGGASGSATTPLSLRQIQEMEAKQAEAKRAAERARRANVAASRGNNDGSSAPPTTISWGLASIPSTVNKTQSSASGSDAGGLTSPSSQAAGGSGVWTMPAPNTGKAGAARKKTLMEIQEEERKQTLAQQRKAAAAASKAFAESLSRQNSSSGGGMTATLPAAAPAPGWSVVGAGGKATTNSASVSPVATPARPAGLPLRTASTASNSGGAWSTAANGAVKTAATVAASASPVAARSRPAAVAATPSTTKVTSLPAATTSKATVATPGGGGIVSTPSAPRDPSVPSAEFLKYCKEQLRALTGVKVDDFIEMLLSFPLDPTPDVVEIIAESIYANSSTLDGRRLANDFVAKRKLDAGFQEGGSGRRGRGAAAAAAVQPAAASNTPALGALNGSAAMSGKAASGAGTSGAASGSGGGGGFQQVVKKSAKRRGANH